MCFLQKEVVTVEEIESRLLNFRFEGNPIVEYYKNSLPMSAHKSISIQIVKERHLGIGFKKVFIYTIYFSVKVKPE